MTPAFTGRRRWLIVLLTACTALAAVGIIGANDAVTYYLTPSEAAAAEHSGRDVRIGGLVVDGSITVSADESSLVLTDGTTQMRVLYAGRLPDVVLEGQGAVVEGSWGSGGEFRGTSVVMRHSNEYRAPSGSGG